MPRTARCGMEASSTHPLPVNTSVVLQRNLGCLRLRYLGSTCVRWNIAPLEPRRSTQRHPPCIKTQNTKDVRTRLNLGPRQQPISQSMDACNYNGNTGFDQSKVPAETPRARKNDRTCQKEKKGATMTGQAPIDHPLLNPPRGTPTTVHTRTNVGDTRTARRNDEPWKAGDEMGIPTDC